MFEHLFLQAGGTIWAFMEHLGSEAQLQEVGYWNVCVHLGPGQGRGVRLEIYSLGPLSFITLLPVTPTCE